MPDVPNIPGSENKHLKNTVDYINKIKDAYHTTINELTLRLDFIKFKGEVFKTADYPILKKMIDTQIDDLKPKIESIVVNGVKDSWKLSNEKNNVLVDRRLGNKNPDPDVRKILYDPNEKALAQFSKRRVNGLSLSDRVWNTLEPFKSELEAGISTGLLDGHSAARIAKDMKQYLVQPDKLFRRVRNAKGNLVLSKAARDYHPGQGVYRSSYKNAVRLTRTENNMAYRTADHERWKNLPFVTGIQVKLSGQHPTADICDSLVGSYPKDFKFVGFHPNCICYAIAIQMTDEEYDKYEDSILGIADYDPASAKHISDTPQSFKDYLKDNEKMLKGLKNEPYWIRDNPQYVGKDLTPVKADAKQNVITREMHIEAVKNYTGETFNAINPYLRGAKSTISDTNKKTIDILDDFLKGAEKKPGVSYRGVGLDEYSGPDFMKKLVKGHPFVDNGFMSTSTSEAIANDFGKKDRFRCVFTVNGKSGVDVMGFSDKAGEREILFNKGSKFTIKNVKIKTSKNGIFTDISVTLDEL